MTENYGLTDPQGKIAEATYYVSEAIRCVDVLDLGDTSDGAADRGIARLEAIALLEEARTLIAETWTP